MPAAFVARASAQAGPAGNAPFGGLYMPDPQRLIDSQRALLSATRDIATSAQDAASKVMQLNLRTWQTALAEGGERLSTLTPATAAANLPDLQLANRSALTAMASYTRELFEIGSGLQGDMLSAVQQQAAAWQTLISETMQAVPSPLFTTGAGNAPDTPPPSGRPVDGRSRPASARA
ncbi:phasin family protein [Aquabacterium sp. A7-Y]|uniref:phasin family protein n=1 Tax=Aquabacterium sp. A7-Y TaxID=1349605 RepID=UPI00223E0717|nr:phasin family protein [Aquabacterium sp. A7-Y]MCW7539335.1 phasin family protein [Aquabacterium sp. A7-Y]